MLRVLDCYGTKEILCENGDIFVKGKLVKNDKEVVDALREFLKLQTFIWKEKVLFR